jgi:hypothetical protein
MDAAQESVSRARRSSADVPRHTIERTRQPSTAFAPPARPLPAPRGTIGTRCCEASRRMLDTSAVDRGKAAASGCSASTVSALSRLSPPSVAGRVTTRSSGSASPRALRNASPEAGRGLACASLWLTSGATHHRVSLHAAAQPIPRQATPAPPAVRSRRTSPPAGLVFRRRRGCRLRTQRTTQPDTLRVPLGMAQRTGREAWNTGASIRAAS